MNTRPPAAASPPHVILHIGVHKTGTTSIQHFLAGEDEFLARNGFALLRGLRGKPNLKELFHAAIAPARRADMVLRQPRIWRSLLRWRLVRHVRRAAARHPNCRLIASSELLSFLREPREMIALKDLFPPGTSFIVVVCLRRKHSFLESYKRQLDGQKIAYGRRQGMSSYVETDSWLVDFDGLLRCFRQLTDDIRVIDFETATAAGNNIIASFCETIGVREPPDGKSLLFLNKRSASGPAA